MGCFINHKKEKIQNIFSLLGDSYTEESFIDLFKSVYPDDWKKICDKWLEEENNTPVGKRHPMQHPDIYMKEMYRNHKPKTSTL